MNNVTIKDIAKELNISTATVSRVLSNRGYASQEIKEKVLAVAKKLNYQPNAIARSLKKHQTNTIGVILPDISNPYFMMISKGIEDTIQQYGYNLIFASNDDNSEKETKMLQVFFEKRVDAIVLASSSEKLEHIEKIKSAEVPVIFVDRKIEQDSIKVDYVGEDNVLGSYMLTKYLIKQGHTAIGVINGPLSFSTGRERYEGFQKAMKEYGIEVNQNHIYYGDFTQKSGFKAAEFFLNLPDKPTAILACNNNMTTGVLRQLVLHGLSNFKDLIIASYGESEAAEFLTIPKIINIKQPPYEMGVRVGEILINRLINNAVEPVFEELKPIFTTKD